MSTIAKSLTRAKRHVFCTMAPHSGLRDMSHSCVLESGIASSTGGAQQLQCLPSHPHPNPGRNNITRRVLSRTNTDGSARSTASRLTNNTFGIELPAPTAGPLALLCIWAFGYPVRLGWAKQMPGPLARRVFCCPLFFLIEQTGAKHAKRRDLCTANNQIVVFLREY